jgi:hypothetical protein
MPKHWIYSYSPASGVQVHKVIERSLTRIVILSALSFCGQSLAIAELNKGHYFTTPALAVQAFIAKADAALAASSRAEGHDGWREAREEALLLLCQKLRAAASRGLK